MTKKNTREITIIQKEISPIVEKAKRLVISNEKEIHSATEMLSRLNQYNDKITEIKEQVTKPLNVALKAERARWKPMEDICGEAIDIIREKMSLYQTEQVRIRKEEELKIAARIKEGKGNLSLEKAVEKIEALDIPQKEVATEAGLVQFREVARLKINDLSLIPREYLIIDEKKALKALQEGMVVSGAEIELIQVPVNYR